MGKLDIQNWFINGALDFWQRIGTTEANLTTSLAYYADRFKSAYAGTVTGTPTIMLNESVTPGLSHRSARVKFQRSGSTFTAAFEQRIEADNAREIGRYGVASASLQVYAPVAGCQVRMTIFTPNALDTHTTQNQIAQTTVNMATSGAWELVKFENNTIPSAAKLGLAVKFELIVPFGTDGSVQYAYFGEFMFNCGKKVKPFQMAGIHIADERNQCLRFYCKSFSLDTAPANGTSATHLGSGNGVPNGLCFAMTYRGYGYLIDNTAPRIFFPVIMRAIPTMASYGVSSGHWVWEVNGLGNYNVVPSWEQLSENGFCPRTAVGQVTWSLQIAAGHWTADAEL